MTTLEVHKEAVRAFLADMADLRAKHPLVRFDPQHREVGISSGPVELGDDWRVLSWHDGLTWHFEGV